MPAKIGVMKENAKRILNINVKLTHVNP